MEYVHVHTHSDVYRRRKNKIQLSRHVTFPRTARKRTLAFDENLNKFLVILWATIEKREGILINNQEKRERELIEIYAKATKCCPHNSRKSDTSRKLYCNVWLNVYMYVCKYICFIVVSKFWIIKKLTYFKHLTSIQIYVQLLDKIIQV